MDSTEQPPSTNPVEPSEPLQKPASDTITNEAHPPQPPLPNDSAVTKAEKVERNGADASNSSVKRPREPDDDFPSSEPPRKRGVAPIKSEYLLHSGVKQEPNGSEDAREDPRSTDRRDKKQDNKRAKNKGQNTSRSFGSSRDIIQLCLSRSNVSEFTPVQCHRGDACKFEHDIRKYLREGKRADLDTLNGKCPAWLARGRCNVGWRCRFASSHSEERVNEDGAKELVLTQDDERLRENGDNQADEDGIGVVNIVSMQDKIRMRKREIATPRSDSYSDWLNKITQRSGNESIYDKSNAAKKEETKDEAGSSTKDRRTEYIEPPFLPSEKRRIYYGPETPILAPLTTQGNLPFRRLCVGLGAQVTWSEMAMSLPLISGEKPEWALMKAHESELKSPKYTPKTQNIVQGYDHGKDIKFGVQISAHKPWLALKATEVLAKFCPHLRAIDLNCGCPIDLVYRQGAGSALMDSAAKLEKMVRGMNAVSGDIPVQIKIRTGTKDAKPTAHKLVHRFAYGGDEASEMHLGPPGVAAITLHGRSRQQRYTRLANWEYISECAAIVNEYNSELSNKMDTNEEHDPRDMSASRPEGRMYFIGNGDCYSHEDYYSHIKDAGVDSVMVARGALIKPWIFEEIATGQYLDKSASERLRYVEQYARFGLETWGSDEVGVGTTRRFLLEWLSFACRYVPVGLLEHMPPKINDRPPAYKGRDDLETLMASDNVQDWIKISDMFLGPANENFRFEPKHKSSSYEVEAEG